MSEENVEQVVEQSQDAPVENTAAEQVVEAPQLNEQELRSQIRLEIEKDMRKQFGKLGRKEQALKQQAEEIEALKKQAEDYKALLEIKESGNRAQLLKKLDVNIDDLTSDLLSGSFEREDPRDSQIAELAKRLEAFEKQQEEAQRLRQQAEVEQQTSQVHDYIKSMIAESDAEMVQAKGESAIEEIYEAAQQAYEANGHVELKDVIAEFEKYYIEEAEKLFETPFAKKAFESKYEAYLAAKAEEKAKTATLSNKIAPAAAPELKGEAFEGKGTAAGLKYLLNKNKK